MQILVTVSGKGYWCWELPGGEAEVRRAWAAGRAPMHLLDEQRRPFDGTLTRLLRSPADPEAIVDIDLGEAILYVGDDAIRWSERASAEEVDDHRASDLPDEVLLVAIGSHTWRFPGTLEELEVELDEGRFPGHLAAGWRGRPAQFVGAVGEGAPPEARVTVELLGPGHARFTLDGRTRDWRGRVERVDDEVSLTQLAARAPVELELDRGRIVGLVAGDGCDVDAIELLLDHPDSGALRRIDVSAVQGADERLIAALIGLPRPALVDLRLPFAPTPEQVEALSRVAPSWSAGG